jgi:hypothetical protein
MNYTRIPVCKCNTNDSEVKAYICCHVQLAGYAHIFTPTTTTNAQRSPALSAILSTTSSRPSDALLQSTPVGDTLCGLDELADDDINRAMALLKQTFPATPGLQATSLGVCSPQKALPSFQAVDEKFVQIFYLPDHWVVGTNIFSQSSHSIFWYDSLPKDFIRSEAVLQVSSLLRNDTVNQMLRFHIRNTDRQPDNTNLCGYYAIAFTVAICAGLDPTFIRFHPLRLVQYVQDGLRSGRFCENLPASFSTAVPNLSIFYQPKMHCLCHRSYVSGTMVTCAACGNHYHRSCVPQQLTPWPPLSWTGPCCSVPMSVVKHIVPDPQDEEVVNTNQDNVYITSSPRIDESEAHLFDISGHISPITSCGQSKI